MNIMDRNDLRLVEHIKQIDAILRAHRQQRVNLELALETAPRESRYSNELIHLMQREEVALREGKISGISKDVDTALATETRNFFSRLSDIQIKKFNALLQKQQRDRDELIQRIRDYITSNSAAPTPRIAEVTPADIELESLRLQAHYNRHWLHHEGFHLTNAFESQKERLDEEWNSHRKQLTEKYNESINTIEATPAEAPATNNRWHSAEKQKLLIHTAPVLSPKVAVGSGVRAVRNTKGKDAEMAKLEKRYKLAIENLESQKTNAVRWMKHQEVRMLAQATETHNSRQPLAKILDGEVALYKIFKDLVMQVGTSSSDSHGV